MDTHPLLVENETKRLNFKLPLLICFALFSAWQMAVVYFSGETLSIDGRTPLPVDIDNLTVLIAAGYILSILVMIFLPRIVVWAERLTACIALLSVLALFLPLPPETLAALYYLQCFCCCFMIGFEIGIIVNLFTEKTAAKYLLIAYAVSCGLIAILQNDIKKVPFPAFRLFSVIALALMLVFFFKLPAKTWPRNVKKSDGLTAPKSLFTGVYILAALGNFVMLFSTAIAETIPHGVMALYLSAAACSVIVFSLWKRFRIIPLQSAKILVALAALGFIVAIAAQFIPALALVSCVLLGAGTVCCLVNPLFGLLLAKQYPSKLIAPALIGIAFSTVLIQTALLEAFRDNLITLYVIYLVIAAALALIYLVVEPYLGYSFRGRTLQEIIGETAADSDEDKVAELQPAKPGPLLIRAAPLTTAPTPIEEPPHKQRMKNLGKQALTPLTSREYQVADAILRGLRRSEIAKEMGVKLETIDKYTSRIYDKYDIHSRQELFKLAETHDRGGEKPNEQ